METQHPGEQPEQAPEIEQPLEETEILKDENGTPIDRESAWRIATQKSEQGMVRGPDGKMIPKSKALRMAMECDFDFLTKQLEAGYTENTIAYLQLVSRMHHYSPGNQELIFAQAPHAKIVRGFKTWTNAGYKIKEGAKAIWIIQPSPIKRTKVVVRDGEPQEIEYTVPLYRAIPVFDDSQIDESVKKVPDFFCELTGNADKLTERLIEIMKEEGITIKEGYVTQGAEGSSGLGLVILRPGLSSVNKFMTLIHEYVHEKAHNKEARLTLSKQDKECQAEAGAFMVASHFGISSPLSADYLRTLGVTKEILKENMRIVQSIIHEIIERMEEEYNLYAEFEYNPQIDENRKQYSRRGKKRSGKRNK